MSPNRGEARARGSRAQISPFFQYTDEGKPVNPLGMGAWLLPWGGKGAFSACVRGSPSLLLDER